MLIRKDGIYRNVKDSAISEYTRKGYEKVPEKPRAQEKLEKPKK